jgi:putative transposase
MRQRRHFSVEFKARVVLEVLSGQKRAAEICREYRLKPDLLSRWKADFVTHAASGFASDERTQQAEQRIAELERMVGRLTVELEVAKKSCLALSREQQRQIAEQLGWEDPLAVVCRVLEVPRSSVYARQHAMPLRRAQEPTLRQPIEQIAEQWPTYGYRRVTAQLRREGQPVNSKRVRRLMGELGVAGQAPKRRCRTTNSDHPYPRYPHLVAKLEVVQPDHVWVADIPYVRLRRDFVYLAVLIMAVYTRAIRGWELARRLDQALTLTAVERAVATGHVASIHHSDQGVHYAATAYVARLRQLGIQISMAEQGEPRQNGYAERLMRTIKEEEVALTAYGDGAHRVWRFRRCLCPDRALPGRRLPAQAYPLGAGLPDAGRVRGGIPCPPALAGRYPLTEGCEVSKFRVHPHIW